MKYIAALTRTLPRCMLLAFLMLIAGISASTEQRESGPTLVVLGVAQDAGFPQAGCYQPRCTGAWQDPRLRHGAVSLGLIDPQARKKYLFEASPQLPEQLYRLNELAAEPEYDLAGVFLSHAHIGHYTGLMYFGHEAQGAHNVPVYAMPRMASFLRDNGPWKQLVSLENILIKPLAHDRSVKLARLSVTPFLVPHRDEFSETVGFTIQGPHKKAVFIPDIDKWAKWDRSLTDLIKSVDYAFLDATFYAPGELPNRDMSKIPHPLVTETMAALAHLDKAQRGKVWFIHFNHTNPLLNRDSEASQTVRQQGFNVAYTGLQFAL